jgi:hypothetical protein
MATLKEHWDRLFGPNAEAQDFTSTTLNAFFDEVEQDPRAGLGNLSKRSILIDKIISQHRIVTAQYRQITPKKPAPAVVGEPIELGTPIQIAAAQAAKKAGM